MAPGPSSHTPTSSFYRRLCISPLTLTFLPPLYGPCDCMSPQTMQETLISGSFTPSQLRSPVCHRGDMCEFQRLGRGQLWEPSFSLLAFICQVSPQLLSPCRDDTPGTSLISPYWGSWQSWTEQRAPQSRHLPADHLTSAGCPKPPQEGALGPPVQVSCGAFHPAHPGALCPCSPRSSGQCNNSIHSARPGAVHSLIHSFYSFNIA